MHWWTPCPNDVCLGPWRVMLKVSACSNASSSRLTDPVSRMTPSPGWIVRPRTLISDFAIRKSVCTGLSKRNISFTASRIRHGSSRKSYICSRLRAHTVADEVGCGLVARDHQHTQHVTSFHRADLVVRVYLPRERAHRIGLVRLHPVDQQRFEVASDRGACAVCGLALPARGNHLE